MWLEAEFFHELDKLKRHIFRKKSHAFSEEKEWRLLAHPAAPRPGLPFEQCSFRMSGGRLIPYLAYELSPLDGIAAIEKIIVGPKNPNPLEFIERYARSAGHENVSVSPSKASYR